MSKEDIALIGRVVGKAHPNSNKGLFIQCYLGRPHGVEKSEDAAGVRAKIPQSISSEDSRRNGARRPVKKAAGKR